MDEEKRKPVKQRCRNDGHKFQGRPEQFVVGYDRYTHKPIFDKRTFCHIACVQFFLRSNLALDPHILNLYNTYLRTERGLQGDIPTAPDPVCLACFNVTGEGIQTIEEYRQFDKSFTLAERDVHPAIDRQIFVQAPQVDHPETFYHINLKNRTLHTELYKRCKDNGEEIPKALLEEENERLALEKLSQKEAAEEAELMLDFESHKENEEHEVEHEIEHGMDHGMEHEEEELE